MNIIAIGGGEIGDKETLAIDRHIVALAGKKRPRALFIPTASGDAPGYCDTFDKIYGGCLGCRTDHLLLFRRPQDRLVIEDKIRAADTIYVGGGNTLRMMKMWRRYGVDHALKQAARSRTVLAGLSAGAICWYEWGHSDSRAASLGGDWPYIRVKGLGLYAGIFCPHLDHESRDQPFRAMLEKHKGAGIACDNGAAVWHSDHGMTCLTSLPQARAYVYDARSGGCHVTAFRDGEEVAFPAGT
jgi:dipeptidase E